MPTVGLKPVLSGQHGDSNTDLGDTPTLVHWVGQVICGNEDHVF